MAPLRLLVISFNLVAHLSDFSPCYLLLQFLASGESYSCACCILSIFATMEFTQNRFDWEKLKGEWKAIRISIQSCFSSVKVISWDFFAIAIEYSSCTSLLFFVEAFDDDVGHLSSILGFVMGIFLMVFWATLLARVEAAVPLSTLSSGAPMTPTLLRSAWMAWWASRPLRPARIP